MPLSEAQILDRATAAFAPLIGQTQAVQLLTQAVCHQRLAPAYLFAGPPGVGRSLAARCFVALVCGVALEAAYPEQFPSPEFGTHSRQRLRQRLDQGNHPDVLWVEASYQIQGKRVSLTQAKAEDLKPKTAPQVRLSQIREIAQFLSRAPLEAPRNLVIVDQAETMGEPAANGLLKTLEEPGQATLILIAPGVESLLPTLVSRCQRIPFQRLRLEQMQQVLHQVQMSEILNYPALLTLAQGSPGVAIEGWHQFQTLPPDLLDIAQQPPTTPRSALSLARQISQQLDLHHQLWLLNYLQHCYWQSRSTPPVFSTPASSVHFLQHLERAKGLLQRSVQPRLVWEVTLLNLTSAAHL